jgi:hypothetical protein
LQFGLGRAGEGKNFEQKSSESRLEWANPPKPRFMKLFVPVTAVGLLISLGMTGCESPAATGALAGAGAGALTGSLIGGRRATLLGAGIGAATGAIIGHEIGEARRDDDYYYEGRRLPYGNPLGHGMVESPYPPHNVIDTRGIPHGAIVEDPSTGGRFIKP